MKMYNKDSSSCIHFCAANYHSQNFPANNDCFVDIFFSKKFDERSLRLLWCKLTYKLFFLFAVVLAEGPSPPKRTKLEGIFIT